MRSYPASASRPDLTGFTRRTSELRQALRFAEPDWLAERTGATYQESSAGTGEFRLSVWGRPTALAYPDFVAHDPETDLETPALTQALLLYYFYHADGAPLAQRWISFSELPDGRFYNQAFQGYTGAELARAFQNDLPALESAAYSLPFFEPGVLSAKQTQPLPGDLALRFRALPRVALLVAHWQGDEDFPANCQVLFDASLPHYLPTDAGAILGSALTRQLIAARPSAAKSFEIH